MRATLRTLEDPNPKQNMVFKSTKRNSLILFVQIYISKQIVKTTKTQRNIFKLSK